MTDLQIRRFDDDDWLEFRPIFDEVVAEGETYALPARMSDGEAQDLWLGPSNAHVVTIRDGSELLGSARMGPNRPAQGSHVGTASFMIASAARGRGAGRRLGEYVVDWHRRQGYRAIQFNAVVSTNTAAVHLWQSLGFEVVGTVPGAFRRPSGEYVDLLVMHLALA